MSVSSSDSESAFESPLNNASKKLLSMKPDFVKQCKSKMKIKEVKNALSKSRETHPAPSSSRTSARKSTFDNVAKIEECYLQLQKNIQNVQNGLDIFHECITGCVESIEMLEERVLAIEHYLEKNWKIIPNPAPIPAPFRDALLNDDTRRLDKLEFLSSEEERKRRMLEVSITHPGLDPNSQNLTEHVKSFMENVLLMERRTIDANLTTRKTSKQNSVIATFSAKRFKLFLFKTRKNLRENKHPAFTGFYLNDNLTTYNYKILMALKNKSKTFTSENNPIASIYSHEGRVFVKLKNSLNEPNHIKSPQQCNEFIAKLHSPPRTPSSASNEAANRP